MILDYKDKNFIGKDFLQYQTDKNKTWSEWNHRFEKFDIQSAELEKYLKE